MGRKKIPEKNKRVNRSISLKPDDWKYLEMLSEEAGDIPVSRVIESLIRKEKGDFKKDPWSA
jgi:hypothetical protein